MLTETPDRLNPIAVTAHCHWWVTGSSLRAGTGIGPASKNLVLKMRSPWSPAGMGLQGGVQARFITIVGKAVRNNDHGSSLA